MMAERKWFNTEPGVLALVGTDFKIVYAPSNYLGDFLLTQGDRRLFNYYALVEAKRIAEAKQDELEEIGVE